MKLKNTVFVVILLSTSACAQEDTTSAPPDNNGAAVSHAQDKGHLKAAKPAKMYHINKAVDYPLTLACGLGAVYAITVIDGKNSTPVADVLNLNKNNIPSFDRWATQYYNPHIDKISYYPFFGVMPLPLILLLDKKIAKDKGAIGVMYLEAFAFEGILYTGSGYLANRFRPLVYNTSLPVRDRVNGNYRNSFFAGHVAVIANATFFMSKVYNDYHPKARIRWVFYGGAAVATIGMGFLRLRAGQHFPSDIATGATVGTLCGLLTPTLHKNRDYRKQKWSMMPTIIDKGAGFTFTYKL